MKRYAPNNAAAITLLSIFLLLSGCGPKHVQADELQVPTARQVTERVYNSTVARFIDVPEEVGEVWLLPTPTPVPDDLFDKVFGKAREILPTAMPFVAKKTERWGTVTVPNLNVRSGPGTDSPVIGGLTLDQRVKIEDESEGWLQVTLPDGQKGWSAAEYFIVEEVEVAAAATPEPDQPDALAAAEGEKGIVLADSLNVRSQPNVTGAVVGSLGRYECIDIVGEEGGWYQVALPSGKSGWSSGDYIQPTDACPTPGPVDTTATGGSESAPRVGQSAPAQDAGTVTTVSYTQEPMVPNAVVVHETNMHECFGGGWDEIRFVPSNTPVQVIGTGPWTPPPEQAGKVGPGPYLKIRIWDGQYGWIAASAVGVDINNVAEISGQCEPTDRIDWSTVVRPTPTPIPRPTPAPRPTPRPTSSVTRYPTTTTTTTSVSHDHRWRDE